MHPILFKIGPVEVRSYGVMLALSFIIGIYLAGRKAEKIGIDKKYIYDLSVYLMIGAILGARLTYVVLHLSDFYGNWLAVINPFHDGELVGIAGMNMLGGVIGAFLLAVIYIVKHNLKFLQIADLLTPYLALGTGITRIGCFLNGCCFGRPTECGCGIVFPEGSIPDYIFHNIPIHPTQLYSSLNGFFMFVVLLYIDKKKKIDGVTFLSWVILYSIFRFFIDFIRYYEDAMNLFYIGNTPITANQGICVLMIILGIAGIYYLRKNR